MNAWGYVIRASVPVLLAAMISVASAGTIVVGSSYSAYDAQFAGVGVLGAVGRITFTGGYASGTYLGDGWVLTAAHVAERASTFYFTVGGAMWTSQSVYIPEEWTGDMKSGDDIALIRLSNRSLVRPEVLLYSGATAGLLGDTVLITGYGMTGDGDTGAVTAGGTLHCGENLIERRGGSTSIFAGYDPSFLFYDFDNPLVGNDGYPWSANSALDWEYLAAPGDSGGGVFVEIGGVWYLAGVNSFTLATDGKTDCDYGDIGSITSVAEYLGWILGTIANAPIPGDANGDGKIDSADLALWQQNYDPVGGVNNTFAMGDFNGDGRIDSADLAIWQQEYDPVGAAPVQSIPLASVPEPATVALLLGGAAVLWGEGRRRAMSKNC